MTDQVLVTPRSFVSASEEPLQMLQDAGCEVTRLERLPNGKVTQELMASALEGMDGVIVGVEPLGPAVVARAKSLRVISKYGVGMDNIAVEAARARDIPVGWTPDANGNAVAELTLGLIFALARRIPQASDMPRAGKFQRVKGTELRGRTLGLIGLGRIGARVAKGVLGLGMHVIAHDPYLKNSSVEGVELVKLEDLYRCSDVISLHLPLTSETSQMISAETFSQMKPGALLINTARGGIVDEEALYQALTSGRLGGAAIDCFSHEPPTDSPLLALENVIGTPHIASHTDEAVAAMGRMAVENVIAGLQGKPLPYPYLS